MNLPYAHLALVTDLDGTLLQPDKSLSEADAAAIADFRAKGGRFGIATGRGIQATREYFTLLQPDLPVILYNGAVLYDTKAARYAYAAYLPAGITPLLCELMEQFPSVGAELLDENGVHVVQDGEYERRHLEITHVPLVFRSLDDIEPTRCMKALFAGAPAEIERMLHYVQQNPEFGIINVTRSHRWFLEILPPDTNKGTALNRLRDLLPAGTVIGTSGDFDNDTAMLLEADACGCPADAQLSVREAVEQCGGFRSGKTCANGFFADWVSEFLRKYA